MEAITTLIDEHRVLQKGLDVLEGVIAETESGKAPSALRVQELLDFLTDFADEGHHRKEEAVLIPNLEQACGGRYLCPHGDTLDRMQKEHKDGHRLIGRMRQALPALTKSAEARKAFAQTARAYLSMQREHIKLEEQDLFPEAEAILVARADDLVTAYAQRAKDAGETRSLQDYERILERIRSGPRVEVLAPAGV